MGESLPAHNCGHKKASGKRARRPALRVGKWFSVWPALSVLGCPSLAVRLGRTAGPIQVSTAVGRPARLSRNPSPIRLNATTTKMIASPAG